MFSHPIFSNTFLLIACISERVTKYLKNSVHVTFLPNKGELLKRLFVSFKITNFARTPCSIWPIAHSFEKGAL